MWIPLKLSEIQQHLAKSGIHCQWQENTDQLVIAFKIEESSQEIPLFVRIFEGDKLLQIVAFLPCDLRKEAVSDIARLLHFLNVQVDMPGFCIDERSKTIFYRYMLPVKDKQLDSTVLQNLIGSAEMACKTFLPLIGTVAAGFVTFEEFMKKTEQ